MSALTWPAISLLELSTTTKLPSTLTLAPALSFKVLGTFSPRKFFTINWSLLTETFIGKCPEHIFRVYLYASMHPLAMFLMWAACDFMRFLFILLNFAFNVMEQIGRAHV